MKTSGRLLALAALFAAASCGGGDGERPTSSAQAGAAGAGGAAGKAGKSGAAGKAGGAAGKGSGGAGAGGVAGSSSGAAGVAGAAGAAGKKPIPTLPGWTHKPGSTDCPVFLPDPGTLEKLPTLDWIPCESGLAGCRQLDRKVFKGGIRGAAISKVGDDLYVTAKFLLEPWTETSMFYTALYGPDGKAVVAWGGVGGICVQPLAARNGRSFLRAIDKPDPWFSFYEGTPQDILAAQIADTPVFGAPAQELTGMSSNKLGDGIAVWGSLGTTVFDFTTKELFYPKLDVPAYYQYSPDVAGRDVWFTSLTLAPDDTVAKYLWKDGAVTKVVNRAPKHVYGFGTDGTWMAWWESNAGILGPQAGIGTWNFVVAPYTTDPKALKPVLDIDFTSLLPAGQDPGLTSNIVMGGGHVVARRYPWFFRAYDPKTGAYRELPYFPVKNDMSWTSGAIYIDAKEVFMSLYDDQTLVRQDLAALPLVLPGGP